MLHSSGHPFFTLGLLLVAGYFCGRAAKVVKLPQVSGYIIAGLVLSPSITGIVAAEQVELLFGFTSELALAFIAYSIGGSLQLSRMRDLGKGILCITFFEGAGAFLFSMLTVYAAFSLFPFYPDLQGKLLLCSALMLGGICVATAPAATMAVIHELRARGPLTTTLLGVVALDDALSIIIFSAAATAAGQITGVAALADGGILQGSWQVGLALLLGSTGGLIFSLAVSVKSRPETSLMLVFGAVFIVSGLAVDLAVSPLLANMMMGFVIANRVKNYDDLFHNLDLIEETLFCLFFTLAAAHFDVKVFKASLLLGLILLLARFAGKLAGAWIGGRVSGVAPKVYHLLGFGLLPQAGLSMGLIFLAKPVLPPDVFDLLLNAMLASIILNEVISPPLVKWSLSQAGECNS